MKSSHWIRGLGNGQGAAPARISEELDYLGPFHSGIAHQCTFRLDRASIFIYITFVQLLEVLFYVTFALKNK